MRFEDYLRAGYPVLWVQTHEEDRAIETLMGEVSPPRADYCDGCKHKDQKECGDSKYRCFERSDGKPTYNGHVWDIVTGLKDLESSNVRRMADPLAPITAVSSLPENSIIFLKDYHKFIEGVETFRGIKSVIPHLKSTCKHIVIVSPVLKVPVEVEKDVTIFPFSLPTGDELLELANRVVSDNALEIEVDEEAVRSGQGMTLAEAENSFALSLVTEKKFSRSIIEGEKLQAIKKSGLLELYPPVSESELGGMGRLKEYIHNRKKGFENPEMYPPPRGILLVGPPGSGKTLGAKVIASVFDVPLLRFDVSSMKSSLVGESEQKMRRATELIDAIGECVVWMDEIEKALGGVQSSNRTDGGTTSAMFGHLLTWMQESKKPKFIVATCNDMGELLALSQGALLRRFDDTFFADLPSEAEREAILEIMLRRYNLSQHDHIVKNWDPNIAKRMGGWTGAEIEKFAIASIYDGIEAAFANVRPVYEQNKQAIDAAREWAKGNARVANSPTPDSKSSNRKVAV